MPLLAPRALAQALAWLSQWAESLGVVEPGPVVPTQTWTRYVVSAKACEVEMCVEVPPCTWDAHGTCKESLWGRGGIPARAKDLAMSLQELKPFHPLSHSAGIVGHWNVPSTARTGRRGCGPALLDLPF